MSISPLHPEWHNDPDQLDKRNMRRFLRELRDKAHHIYALLAGAPKSVCRICRYDDSGEKQEYTLKEFNADLRNIHCCTDTLQIHFNAYFFRDEWDACCPYRDIEDGQFNGIEKFTTESAEELSVELFEKEYPHMLAYLCREAILANNTFGLGRETVKHYRFTRADVALLRPQVMRINQKIIEELSQDLDRLIANVCLQPEARIKFPRPRIKRISYTKSKPK